MPLFRLDASPPRPRFTWAAALFCSLLILTCPASAAVSGRVVNRTTNQPASGVLLTLISFAQGMDPIEETQSGADGSFRFEKPLNGPGVIRSEYAGVSYSQMLPPGRPTEGIDVEVFEVAAGEIPAPSAHVMLFEPDGASLTVTESFIFENQTNPPKAYRDAERGTLRFYLPPAANGQVDVRATGPAGMPLQNVADPTSEANVYKIDFPIKPGENRIDLNYKVPRTEDGAFAGRTLYDGVSTRVAVPPGVSLEADGLKSLGNEPRTQAALYELEGGRKQYEFKITGEGRLQGADESEAPAAGSSPNRISVQNAPIDKEYGWILVIAFAILGIGFFRLYTSRSPEAAASTAESPDRRPSTPSGKSRAVRRKG